MLVIENYKETIFSFKGPISIDVIVYFTNYMKHILQSNQRTFMKIYKIFIEVTQNISFYSADVYQPDANTKEGIGEFQLRLHGDTYYLVARNLVTKEDGVKLNSKCEYINSLDMEGVRNLKRKTRVQTDIQDKGAHIGLMHISLLSKSKLEFDILDIDEQYSFFAISVAINKQQ